MARKKLTQITESFQRIFGLTSGQMRSRKYIDLRQQALLRVSIWDGRFPNESNDDAVKIRQMDEGSRYDNPKDLANYLRRLKCVGNEKDDWSCIFYAFKNYVYGHESEKDIALANKILGGAVQEKKDDELPINEEQSDVISQEVKENEDENVEEVTEQKEVIDNDEEVATTEVEVTKSSINIEEQEGTVENSLPHRSNQNIKEEEKEKMANITDVEKMLEDEANGGVTDKNTANATPTMNPGGNTQVAGSSNKSSRNSIDVSNVGTQNMSGVTSLVESEWEAREEWSRNRSVKKVLCSGKPAAYKLVEYNGPSSNIFGELASPANKVLEAIATTMYSVDQNKRTNGGKTLKKEVPENGTGYIYDEEKKEVKVPECVKNAGQAAMDDYKAVVELLVSAGDSRPKLKVKITNAKPNISGVLITNNKNGEEELYKITDLRDAMVMNSNLGLEYSTYSANDPVNKHSLLAAMAVSRVAAKNVEKQGAYVKLVFGNRSKMFDNNTGDLTEYGSGIVDYIREITNEEDTDPRAIISENGFQYKTPDGKLRTYSLRVTARTYAVKIVESYQGIVGATAGRNVSKVDPETARKETMKLLNTISAIAPSSTIGQKVKGVALKGSANSDRLLAEEAVGSSEAYEAS